MKKTRAETDPAQVSTEAALVDGAVVERPGTEIDMQETSPETVHRPTYPPASADRIAMLSPGDRLVEPERTKSRALMLQV